MNWKEKGEKGERIAIGELAKFDINIAIPLSDNLPFDFIAIYNDKLYRVQVKSSERKGDYTEFDMRTNNWYSKTSKKYTKNEIDIMLLCDYEYIFILSHNEFDNRGHFTIRYSKEKQWGNNQHFFEDFVLSKKRIQETFK